MAVERGFRVIVRTASNEHLPMVALTGIVRGRGFPVVRVCTPAEWDQAERDGTDPDWTPWPAEDVTEFAEHMARVEYFAGLDDDLPEEETAPC